MYEVERIVAIIKPTQKMLEFLRHQPGQNEALSLDDIQSDCTALLIPLFDSPEDAHEYIDEIYLEIFQNELLSWGVEKSMWPEILSIEMFEVWFEIEFHSIVYDLCEPEEPQISEEDEEEEEEVKGNPPLQ